MTKGRLRKENKALRAARLSVQHWDRSYWKAQEGTFHPPTRTTALLSLARMEPSRLALCHPAAPELLRYATGGCPVHSGKPWTKEAMQAAVD